MSGSSDKPAPGSRSETASAIRDGAVGAAEKAATTVALTTDIFTAAATLSGIYEIQAAEVALQRSRREDVKAFARQMIEDHTELASKLKSFLGGMNRPNDPPQKLDRAHQDLIDDLNGASDENFDKRYISQQISAHANAITLFSNYSKRGDKEGLRNLAALALPVLERHMEMARKLGGPE